MTAQCVTNSCALLEREIWVIFVLYISFLAAAVTASWQAVFSHSTNPHLPSLCFLSYILQELLPLVLSFELPAIMQSDPSSPTVQHISQTYNLTVSFKPPTRLYRATGVVRGSQNNTNAVKVRKFVGYWHAWKCCLVMLVEGWVLPLAWYIIIKHKTTPNDVHFFPFVLF